MKFFKTEGTSELENALIAALSDALDKKRSVLWLVPGGSNVAVAVKVMSELKPENLDKLTIALTDERFGPVGHADSNFFQLHQSGFNERNATFADLLSGKSFEDTVKDANITMSDAFNKADQVIAFLGMGPDGHTAGILPNSPAVVSDEVWVIGYDGGEHQRFTLTPFALSHINEAYVGTYGNAKKPALEILRDQTPPVAEQPAQLLKKLPETYIFNDQIGDA